MENKDKIGCGKELMTSRTERDDAVLCGDTYNEELHLCSKCRDKEFNLSEWESDIRGMWHEEHIKIFIKIIESFAKLISCKHVDNVVYLETELLLKELKKRAGDKFSVKGQR